ncbi:MAG: putative membrane protein [Anaerolineales bacterium]|nr:putative membrane protein [Anaerolineales bacterium]
MARIVIGVLVPVVLILSNVRLLLTPLFVSVEYSTPGFPDDPYGFTRGERVRLAEIARAYLLNDAGPEFLAELRDSNGIALFNPRELSHMVDVRVLVQGAVRVWTALLFLLAGVGFAAWRFAPTGTVRRGLNLGARITLFTMVALVGLLLLSFSVLFTGFHQVFFQSGTWVFYTSDTLIRLFPMRFWRDVFALLMALTLVEAALLLWVTRRKPAARDGLPALAPS